MPSKAKKNKRRMRKVQAQRRRLEEFHAANPPAKAGPSIAVGAPGTVSKKGAKKAAPQKVPLMVCKIPEAVPVPVEAPKIIPEVEPPKEEPVVALVEVEAVAVLEPEPEPVLEPEPEPVPVPELEPEPEVVVHEVEIPEVPGSTVIDEQVIEEATPEEATPVEVTPEEATPVEVTLEEATPVEVTPVEVVQEVEEPIIPEAENEVALQVEAPVSAPAEIEIVPEETPVITEIEQDIAIPNEEISVEEDALPLPLLTPAPEPVSQIEEIPMDTADIMVDDFVVTDTEVIEPKTIELLPVFEKMTSEPELITAAEDKLNGADVEELMPEQCPIPLDQESVTNTSINTLIGTEWMAQQQVPGLDC